MPWRWQDLELLGSKVHLLTQKLLDAESLKDTALARASQAEAELEALILLLPTLS
jgi:hypothetical protein